MWDNLHSFAKVVTAAFFGDNFAVDFPSSNVVVRSEGNREETFVVSKVKICFPAIIQDEALRSDASDTVMC